MKVYHIYADGKTVKDITTSKKGNSEILEGQYNLMFHPERKTVALTKNDLILYHQKQVIAISLTQLKKVLGAEESKTQ